MKLTTKDQAVLRNYKNCHGSIAVMRPFVVFVVVVVSLHPRRLKHSIVT
jgi:hypothetical protein